MDWDKVKKNIAIYSPIILKFVVDLVVSFIRFLKKQIIYAIKLAFGKE